MGNTRCMFHVNVEFRLLVCCLLWFFQCCLGCPKIPDSDLGTLNFTKAITDQDFVRFGHNIVLECCTSGYDSLLWFHRAQSSDLWQAYPPYCDWCTPGTNPNLRFGNQSLIIPKAGKGNNGQYMCVASNTTRNISISHITSLSVYSCVERPVPLPLPPHDVYIRLHQNATFSCAGDFGCSHNGMNDVFWHIGINYINNLNNSRYVETKSQRNHGTLLEANLTIINVQPEDFDRIFTCSVISDVVDANKHFDVKLKKEISYILGYSLGKFVGLLVGITVGALLILVSTFIGLKHFYGPQLILYVKSRIPAAHFLQKGNKKYHVFIFHGDEDIEERNFGNFLKTELQERGYSAACVMDIMGNQNTLSLYGEYLANSAAIFFVEANVTELYDVYLVNALANFSPKSISVVLRTNTITEFTSKKEFKGLYHIKWPGDESSSRRKNKFFSSLFLRLPRSHQAKGLDHPQRVATENDEEQALLQTPNTASPDAEGDHVFNFEPNIDAVLPGNNTIQTNVDTVLPGNNTIQTNVDVVLPGNNTIQTNVASIEDGDNLDETGAPDVFRFEQQNAIAGSQTRSPSEEGSLVESGYHSTAIGSPFTP